MSPTAIHVAGVTAVWMIFLSAIRFLLAGGSGLKPVAWCAWHLLRCRDEDKRACRRRLIESLDRQYAELLIAVTTKWSVAMLFAGMLLTGAGLSMGSVGDIAQLVAHVPGRWSAFDRSMDLTGAVAICGGMALIHAAVTTRRTISAIISIGFAITGFGIGMVTAVHP